MESRILLTGFTCQVLGAAFANNAVFNNYSDIPAITDQQIDDTVNFCLRVFERVDPLIAKFQDKPNVRI